MVILSARRILVSVAISALCGTGASAQVWLPLGPAPAVEGQLEGMDAQRNPTTGAVRIVLPHPLDPQVLYIGAVNGGVWRTGNALSPAPRWESLTDDQPSLSIGALEFDTLDTTYQTLIAGIGRFSSFGSTGGAQIGLIRTTDGGDTWTQLGMIALANRNITSVAARGVFILAGSNGGTLPGLYRSDNTGETFALISGLSQSGLPSGGVTAIKGDPEANGRFYCTVLGANGGVFKSVDFGATWTNVTNGRTALVANMNRADNAKIAIHNSPGANVVYVSVDVQGQLNGVYRSEDRGGDWAPLGFPTTFETTCDVGVNPGSQGTIHMSLAADPIDPNLIYVGGDRQPGDQCDGGIFPNSSGARDYDGRLFRGDATRPAETRWRPLTHDGTPGNSAPHADSRSMALNPLGDLIESDDGGVYKRMRPATEMGEWVSVIGDLSVGEFHSSAWDHVAHVGLGGTQDTGSSEQEFSGSPVWITVFGGDGGKVAVDTSEVSRSYRYGSAQFLGGFHRRLYNENNTLMNFEFPALLVQGTNPPQDIFQLDNAQFYSPIVANRVFGPGLAILMGRHVFVTYDRGDSCIDLGAPFGTPAAVVFGGRRNGEDNAHVTWVGCTSSRLFLRTYFTGPLNQIVNYPGTPNATIRGIDTSPDDWGFAAVAENARVFVTLSAGDEWREITGNLPTLGETAIRALRWVRDPARGDLIVVGGNKGVLATPAGTPGVWEQLGAGLPRSPVRELDFDANDELLLAATLGRANWTLDLTPCPADFNRDGGVDGADVESFYIAWQLGQPRADVNRDGGVDGGDVEFFFSRWEQGGCE